MLLSQFPHPLVFPYISLHHNAQKSILLESSPECYRFSEFNGTSKVLNAETISLEESKWLFMLAFSVMVNCNATVSSNSFMSACIISLPIALPKNLL